MIGAREDHQPVVEIIIFAFVKRYRAQAFCTQAILEGARGQLRGREIRAPTFSIFRRAAELATAAFANFALHEPENKSIAREVKG